MTLSLAFDIAFAGLLVITIGYAIVLNRKLGNLRRHKEELERLALTFSQSTARADDSIQRLKSSTDVLQKGIEKAQGLRDDLSFLIDRGTLAADRLEVGVRGTRNHRQDAASAKPKRPVEGIETISDAIAARKGIEDTGVKAFAGADADTDEDFENQKSQAERDLIEALRQVR
ncbi:MAG: hypothetical protein ISR53_10610 [Rhodospirillales bacterium]|nr:hypothetical protein [Rhodospirillales bacterium]